MKRITTLIAIIALGIASVPAGAALNAYLLVTGRKQGKFNGANESKSHRIPVLSFDETVQGVGSGKKPSSTPFKVEIGQVDMQEFATAARNGEDLTSVQLELVKPGKAGQVVVYCIIKLTNAFVTSVETSSKGSGVTQEITFKYERMTTSYPNMTQGVDDWTKSIR